MSAALESLAGRLGRDGFALVPELLDADAVAALVRCVEALAGRGGMRSGGMRHLLARSPEIRALAACPALRGVVEPVLGSGARAVRGVLFDKTPGANWNVAWHQDRMIAVREKREVPGFLRWSVKDGVPHVQPPDAVLAGMLTVRIHLDRGERGSARPPRLPRARAAALG